MATLSLGLSGANRLGGQFNLLSGVSSDTTLYTPEAVLMNVIEILKRSNSLLRYGLTIAVPVIVVGAALSQFELAIWAFKAVKVALQKQVMVWLAQDKLKDTHLLALTERGDYSPLGIKTSFSSDDLDDLNDESVQQTTTTQDDHEEFHKLILVPDVGQHNFTFEGYRMRFSKTIETYHDPNSGKPEQYEVVYVSCLSMFAGAKPLHRFLDRVKKDTTETHEAMTSIHRPEFVDSRGHGRNEVRWDYGAMRPSRKLDAVVLDKSIKNPLLKDIQD
ncbi:hypothetical protein LTR27_008899 [Elasticomyces elasticus]|nr:hypothetical protein LTR27_008899 [Elasticomyces elasticus]